MNVFLALTVTFMPNVRTQKVAISVLAFLVMMEMATHVHQYVSNVFIIHFFLNPVNRQLSGSIFYCDCLQTSRTKFSFHSEVWFMSHFVSLTLEITCTILSTNMFEDGHERIF